MSIQRLVIADWHPTTSPNAQRRHWRAVQHRHHVDRDMAWASAMQAGWQPEPGRVRLTITLVYPRKYRVDADNLVARVKGCLDGLKDGKRAGFFRDDSTDVLELLVRAEVRKGCKSTEMVLEGLP